MQMDKIQLRIYCILYTFDVVLDDGTLSNTVLWLYCAALDSIINVGAAAKVGTKQTEGMWWAEVENKILIFAAKNALNKPVT